MANSGLTRQIMAESRMQFGNSRRWYRFGYRVWDASRRTLIFIFLSLCSPLLWAKQTADPCQPDLKIGSLCRLAINQLHPTQPGIGLLQVQAEVKELKHKSAKKLWALAEKKRIPVVIGPDGRYWLVDRHHLTRTLWSLGMREVPVVIAGVLTDREQFWPQMQANHWAWLKDERGHALAPAQLPTHIALLPDYPYRSLAGFAEDAGLYAKRGQIYFIEFAWAQYLGEKLKWRKVTADNLPTLLKASEIFACLPDAAQLPGYPGVACDE
jgi:hypothetical protein